MKPNKINVLTPKEFTEWLDKNSSSTLSDDERGIFTLFYVMQRANEDLEEKLKSHEQMIHIIMEKLGMCVCNEMKDYQARIN